MIKFRKLESDTDLLYFAKRYKIRSRGGIISLAYLKSSHVYALENNNSEILGGFILNNSSEKRLLSYIPKTEKENVSELNLDSKEVMEITCIWIEKGTFSSHFQRLQFYYNIIRESASYKEAKYCIGGSQDPKLMHIQMSGFEKVVWEGMATTQKSSHYQWIYISRQRPLVKRVVVGAVRISNYFISRNARQLKLGLMSAFRRSLQLKGQ